MSGTSWSQHIVIRALTNSKLADISEKVLADLSPDLFISESYRLAFERLLFYYTNKSRLLTWPEIINDETIPEKARSVLRGAEIKRKSLKNKDSSLCLPSSIVEIRSHIDTLAVKAKKNRLVEIQNTLTEKLSKKLSKKEIDEIYTETVSSLEKGSRLSEKDRVLYKGVKEEIKETIINFGIKLKNRFFIPTGFTEFDKINMGIPKDSYFLISGKTGSGKTSLALQLAVNMKNNGARVCWIPLEMTTEQMLLKLASNLLKVKTNDLVKDFDSYKKKIYRTLTKFYDDECACLHFYMPDLEDTLVDVLQTLKPLSYDVIYVDYLGLLAPIPAQTEARSFDLAGRYAKVFATTNQCIVCLLAQFDDDANRVRYSRALVEHASNAWQWFENKDDIAESGYLEIRQKKARGQDPRSFKVRADLATSSFSDFIEDEVYNEESDEININKHCNSERKNR